MLTCTATKCVARIGQLCELQASVDACITYQESPELLAIRRIAIRTATLLGCCASWACISSAINASVHEIVEKKGAGHQSRCSGFREVDIQGQHRLSQPVTAVVFWEVLL